LFGKIYIIVFQDGRRAMATKRRGDPFDHPRQARDEN
jgi:hypothetical protein